MNYISIAEELQKLNLDKLPESSLNAYVGLRQSTHLYNHYASVIPKHIQLMFKLDAHTDIGIEKVLTATKTHTDTNGRLANLLLLISDTECVIQANNCEHHLVKGDLFCLDTTKLHKGINLSKTEPSVFFTVNRGLSYEELSEFYADLLK